MSEDLLWPRYAVPTDLTAIEAVPLVERGLPETTTDSSLVTAALDQYALSWQLEVRSSNPVPAS